jgi:hypothetical protein
MTTMDKLQKRAGSYFVCFLRLRLVPLLISGYRPPHRNQVQRELKRLYAAHMRQMKRAFIAAPSLALTTDLWADRKSRSYLCLTGHYLDDDMNVHSSIIHFQAFDTRHLAVNIGTEVRSRLHELNIQNKVASITSDGGSNIRAACSTHLKISRLWCFAHRMHLTICNGLGLWKKFVKKESDVTDQEGVDDSQACLGSPACEDPEDDSMETSEQQIGNVDRSFWRQRITLE